MTEEAKRAFNFMHSGPYANTTLEESDLRSMLLETTGTAIVGGLLYEIVSRPIGVGVYKLTLHREEK